MKFTKFFIAFSGILLLSACGSTDIISTPIANIDTVPVKVSDLADGELKAWNKLDIVNDTIPGMSVDKAYNELLKSKKGKTVIVGIIDSGVDIEHEDLKNVIWTNAAEKPGNGIDDDKNGYVDDIHGWNFLGDSNDEQLEYVRIVKKGDDGSATYKEAKAKLDAELAKIQPLKQQIDFLEKMFSSLDAHFKGKEYVKKDVEAINTSDAELNQYKSILLNILNSQEGMTVAGFKEEVVSAIEYVDDQVKYNLNVDFDGRSVVGDNPDDFNDRNYGNNNVIGPVKKDADHGTHVAGIVAAQRNNGIGADGVAKNVKIMAIRAVPNGDEYDKDIALAIRYAADNGAKVINMSFGKSNSPHQKWVSDAIKYAASKDVLIVNAAGNDAANIDQEASYPTDYVGATEIADNFITVGALNFKYGGELVANFSNYGKENVDVFAPGVEIYSTIPDNKYDFFEGTSMAAPGVSGVAALIRSYYPKLSAPQVKQILMNSGLPVKTMVILGGDPNKKDTLKNISKSGKMVNAYNALILAEKVSKGKVTLLSR